MLTIDNTIDPNFTRVQELWRKSKKVITLTGAGISTSCGVPDFRSSTGLSSMTVQEALVQVQSRLEDRFDAEGQEFFVKLQNTLLDDIEKDVLKEQCTRLFYRSALSRRSTMVALFRLCALMKEMIYQTVDRPSKMHELIQQSKKRGRLGRWLTQNIDGIEGKTGCKIFRLPSEGFGGRDGLRSKTEAPNTIDMDSFDVVQIHGGLDTVWCYKAPHFRPVDKNVQDALLQGISMECNQCPSESSRGRGYQAGWWRPAIVLYNDDHPNAIYNGGFVQEVALWDVKRGTDLLLIAGTSLKADGAANLVRDLVTSIRKNRKGKKERSIMVGRTKPPTVLEPFIDIFIKMDCDAFAEAVWVKDAEIVATTATVDESKMAVDDKVARLLLG